MARQGISTGTSPNSGTGDTLLSGGIKINENFSEIYTLLGDGTTLAPGIVTSILAGDNIVVGSSTGQVTITGIAQTSNIISDTIVNSGVTTSTNGFISAASTSACQITFVGNQLTFTVSGIGSTTLTLS